MVINNHLKEDLISKRPHEEDGRRQVLSLTLKGRKLIEEVFPKNQKCIEDCFSVWAEKEIEMLHAVMKKFRKEHYES
ncbi:MAG: MarR family winged helix-turn-helix transcriptional regulator [Eubacteriales bacterium]|nr:MarR family winged helix-turn-helix transcriptional regulator [Clostridiales bacterium]MDY5836455.1 MarR family winged helix-turn-helix transcriptional regulator [Eubacteriales bacterium]